jgi:hypothetical protein
LSCSRHKDEASEDSETDAFFVQLCKDQKFWKRIDVNGKEMNNTKIINLYSQDGNIDIRLYTQKENMDGQLSVYLPNWTI